MVPLLVLKRDILCKGWWKNALTTTGGAVECSKRANFNRFKNEGHCVNSALLRGRWFEQHRWIRLPLLKPSWVSQIVGRRTY